MQQSVDQVYKHNSEYLFKTDYLDMQDNSKRERRGFKIPQKVKMEYINQKSQLFNNPTCNNLNQNEDILREKRVLEQNMTQSNNQILQIQTLSQFSQTTIPNLDQTNKLKSPFQIRLSREEGEQIADIMIDGLEQEIKIIFQVGIQKQETSIQQNQKIKEDKSSDSQQQSLKQSVQLKQDQISSQIQKSSEQQLKQQEQLQKVSQNQDQSHQQNKQISKQLDIFKQELSSKYDKSQNQGQTLQQEQSIMTRSLNFISDIQETKQPLTSRASESQNQIITQESNRLQNQQQVNNNVASQRNQFDQRKQQIQNEFQQNVEENFQDKLKNLRSRENILRQHEFLRSCNAFRQQNMRENNQKQYKSNDMNKSQEIQIGNDLFMNNLKNRLKISLFLVSLFKQKMGKIQHQILYFYNQEQMCDYLNKLCSISKYEDEMQSLFDKFLQCLWHFSSTNMTSQQQDSQSSEPLSNFTRYSAIYDHFKLFIYGIELPLPRIENYAAHRAVFEGNLPLLRRILIQQQKQSQKNFEQQQQQNEDQTKNIQTQSKLKESQQLQEFLSVQNVDLFGFSPLQLAIQMESRESVIVCCENGSDPQFKSCPGILSAIEMAIAKKNESMLKQILFALQKKKQDSWEKNLKEQLQQTLSSIPDFSCQMKWEQESSFFLPFLKRWTPQDTYKIFKRGKQVRIDMGLSNIDQQDNSSDRDEIQQESGDLTSRSTTTKQINNGSKIQQSKSTIQIKQDKTLSKQNSINDTSNNSSSSTKESNNNKNNDKTRWNKGTWSLLLKESGELLLIDHNKLTTTSINQDVSMTRMENKIDDLISSKKEIESWGDVVSETIQQVKATKYSAKANLIQEQINYNTNENYLKKIPFNKFQSFDEYYRYSLKHSIIPIQYSNSSSSVIDQFITICSKNTTLNDDSSASSQQKNNRTTINSQKSINTEVWLTEETQLKIKHIIPIISLIGATTSNFQNLQNLFTRIESSHSQSFPIKIVIPLFLTFNVTVEFQQFDYVPPTQHLFTLDEQIRKRQISLQAKQNQTNNQNQYNQIKQYNPDQQKTLKKLYSSLNKYKSNKQNGPNSDDEEEEDQSILDEASLQFRNILDSKNNHHNNDDLVDVFQEQNNVKSQSIMTNQNKLIQNTSQINSISILDSTSTPPRK